MQVEGLAGEKEVLLGYGGKEGEEDVEPEWDAGGWNEPKAGGGGLVYLNVVDEL